jgi:hypothetical protein
MNPSFIPTRHCEIHARAIRVVREHRESAGARNR